MIPTVNPNAPSNFEKAPIFPQNNSSDTENKSPLNIQSRRINDLIRNIVIVKNNARGLKRFEERVKNYQERLNLAENELQKKSDDLKNLELNLLDKEFALIRIESKSETISQDIEIQFELRKKEIEISSESRLQKIEIEFKARKKEEKQLRRKEIESREKEFELQVESVRKEIEVELKSVENIDEYIKKYEENLDQNVKDLAKVREKFIEQHHNLEKRQPILYNQESVLKMKEFEISKKKVEVELELRKKEKIESDSLKREIESTPDILLKYNAEAITRSPAEECSRLLDKSNASLDRMILTVKGWSREFDGIIHKEVSKLSKSEPKQDRPYLEKINNILKYIGIFAGGIIVGVFFMNTNLFQKKIVSILRNKI